MLKKYKGLILLISLFLISILVYIGLFLICSLSEFNILLSILFQIIGFVIILPLFVALHETGHLVFGLVTGYSVLSFKLGPFEWYSSNDKVRFRVNPISSFVLGQCLMSPPKKKKRSKPKFYLYNAGGLIFSYISTLVFILLFFLINNVYIKFLFVPIISLSVFLLINNSMYQEGGFNDVCNHMLVKKNPKYLNAIMYQLEMVSNIYNGKRYGAKTSYEPYFESKLNHITLAVVQFKFLQAIDKDDFETAKKMSELLLKNYHGIFMLTSKVSVLFEILYTDLVIDMNMNAFRRHFKWIGVKEETLCKKYAFDLSYYYNIYNKIYNKDYSIEDDISLLYESEAFNVGEKLSIKKKFDILLEKINFYVSNGNSFKVEE